MMKNTLFPTLLGLLFSLSGYSQDTQPELDIIWTAMVTDAGITPSEIKTKLPSFPYSNSGVNGIDGWLANNPGNAETIMGIFKSHDFFPSRIQLGLGEKPANYRSLLGTWGNALSTYGSEELAFEALPHMPNPADYCSVSGYEQDWKKEQKWRDEQGYGPEADANLSTENATDVNELLDESKFPCLGQYFAAIDYWVYEHPLEYVKYQTECGCGDDVDYSNIIILPDSIKPPYMSPMERFREKETNEHLLSESDKVYLPSTNDHPLAVLKSIDDDLDQQRLEELLDKEDGGNKFRDFLKEHTLPGGFIIALKSSAAYYYKADSKYYDVLKSAAPDGEDFFTDLESDKSVVIPVSNEEFINLFQTEQE